MRVLVVPKWYPWPPDQPVLGAFCREHARALATRHDVVVMPALATPDPPFKAFAIEDAVEDGLRTVRVRYRRPAQRPLAMGFHTTALLEAFRRLRGEGWVPDIVHAHVYQAGPPALSVAKAARAPLVITEHYTGFRRGLVTGTEEKIARLAFKGADLVAPVSDELADHIRPLAGGTRIEVVANTVDTTVFKPPESRPAHAEPRLLAVAALAEKKRLIDLVEALPRIPNAWLAIVGEGPERPWLKRRAQELGLADRLWMPGELPRERIADLMREADVFVLPSEHENQPVVLIEAQASGLPAVATRVGGVPDIVGPEQGELVAPGKPAELAAAINHVLAARELYDPAALHAHAAERFGLEPIADRWTELYAELLRSRGRTSSATVRSTRSGE